MRNFGAPAYSGPVESVKSMLPKWLTWKTAILLYGVRAASGYFIFREAKSRFEAVQCWTFLAGQPAYTGCGLGHVPVHRD